MRKIEYGLKEGLIEWKMNELFSEIYITIKDVYPKNDDDLIRIFEDLVAEEYMDEL